MKHVSKKTGLAIRLGVLVTAMLFGQQALAAGTRANTLVENDVSVDYDVNGVAQATETASADFVVDRRVNFTMSVTNTDLAPVVPGGPPTGDPDYYVEFTLTNLSNDVIDFALDLNQINNVAFGANADVDNIDFTTVDYAVSADTVAGTNPDPVRGGPQFVDQLDADQSIRIWVFADPQLGLANGDIAGVSLEANGAVAGSGGATLLTEAANTDLGVENVFADDLDGVDNSETAEDGFIVETADLTVTKDYSVEAGDLGSGLPIPGATIQYTITVDNASPDAGADDVTVVDTFDTTNTTFLADAYDPVSPGTTAGDQDVRITVGATVTTCTAAVDADDCDLVGDTLTVGADGTYDIAASTTMTVEFQVVINDPNPTP